MVKADNADPPSSRRGTSWIDDLTDEQCAEVFWLYVDEPDEFLARHPQSLLGAAMRYALREVAQRQRATDGSA